MNFFPYTDFDACEAKRSSRRDEVQWMARLAPMRVLELKTSRWRNRNLVRYSRIGEYII